VNDPNVAGDMNRLRVGCLTVELIEYSRDNIDGIRSGKRRSEVRI
jgi:hypothetical protein